MTRHARETRAARPTIPPTGERLTPVPGMPTSKDQIALLDQIQVTEDIGAKIDLFALYLRRAELIGDDHRDREARAAETTAAALVGIHQELGEITRVTREQDARLDRRITGVEDVAEKAKADALRALESGKKIEGIAEQMRTDQADFIEKAKRALGIDTTEREEPG